MSDASTKNEPVLEAELATPLLRVVAAVVDMIVLAIPTSLLTYGALFIGNPLYGPDSPTLLSALAGSMLGLLLFPLMHLTYEVVGTRTWGRTLGKAALGIRVGTSETNTTLRVDYRSALIRYAVKWLEPLMAVINLAGLYIFMGFTGDWLPVLWGVVILITIATHDKRQGWHDRAANTFVLKG